MIIEPGRAWLKREVRHRLAQAAEWFKRWTRPATEGLVIGTVYDLTRNKGELIAESALRVSN